MHAALGTRPSAVQAAVSEYALAVSRIDAAADALRRAAPSPRRDASLALAAAASESQVEILRTLSARLPEAAQPGIQRAIDAHQRIHTPRR